jgi:protein-tyrosine phosphatase
VEPLMKIRTSDSHPLRVDFVEELPLPGRLGLTMAPGKKGWSNYGGPWDRDLQSDLERLVSVYRTDVLVSLLEPYEFELLEIPDLLESARQRGMRVRHLSIRDVSIPGSEKRGEFEGLVAEIADELKAGRTVVTHCRGGLGRAGLTAACVLVRCGAEPDEAIATVRRFRKGAIETLQQERFVQAFAVGTETA